MTFIEISEVLGNLGEFVGSIGIVVSLIYLAIQIRRDTAQTALQTKDVHATAFQNLIDHHSSLQMGMITNDELRDAVRKARQEPDAMSAEEVRLYRLFTTQQMRSFYNAYHLFSSGLIDREQWKAFEGNITRVATSARFNAFWDQAKHDYPEQFQAEIDDYRIST